MSIKAIYGKVPQTIELSDGRVLHLKSSSYDQRPTEKEPYAFITSYGECVISHYQLCNYYKSFVPTKIFFSTPNRDGEIRIKEKTYLSIKKKFDAYYEKQEKLAKCTDLNNKGIELEKAGDIDAAIAIYELNISGSCYPARHAFNRLLVLYRKSKNYKAEKKVCQKALRLFGKIESENKKYSERLEKINKLLGE
jgi:tetratricopeptide (TPR) repeat protein